MDPPTRSPLDENALRAIESAMRGQPHDDVRLTWDHQLIRMLRPGESVPNDAIVTDAGWAVLCRPIGNWDEADRPLIVEPKEPA